MSSSRAWNSSSMRSAPGESVSAIRCEDTELILRGCSFRRPARAGRSDRDFAAVRVRAARPRAGAARNGRRPSSPITATSTAARPPSGPKVPPTSRCGTARSARPSPSIWFDETRAGAVRRRRAPADAHQHPRRPGPDLPVRGGPVRARVDDCVIARGRSRRRRSPRAGRGPAEPELARPIQPLRSDRRRSSPRRRHLARADLDHGFRGLGADPDGAARGGVAGVRPARLGRSRPAPGAGPGASEPDPGLPAESQGRGDARTSGPARDRSDRS